MGMIRATHRGQTCKFCHPWGRCHQAAHSTACLVAGGGENAVAPYQLLAALSRRLEGEETATVVDGELTRVYAGRVRTRGHAKHTRVAHTSKINFPMLIYEIKLPRHKPNTAVLVCLLCVNLHQTKRSQVGNLTVLTSRLGTSGFRFLVSLLASGPHPATSGVSPHTIRGGRGG